MIMAELVFKGKKFKIHDIRLTKNNEFIIYYMTIFCNRKELDIIEDMTVSSKKYVFVYNGVPMECVVSSLVWEEIDYNKKYEANLCLKR